MNFYTAMFFVKKMKRIIHFLTFHSAPLKMIQKLLTDHKMMFIKMFNFDWLIGMFLECKGVHFFLFWSSA